MAVNGTCDNTGRVLDIFDFARGMVHDIRWCVDGGHDGFSVDEQLDRGFLLREEAERDFVETRRDDKNARFLLFPQEIVW